MERRELLVRLGLSILGGLLLRWSFGLHPLWWLAWVAPAPLLVAVLRSGPRLARALAFLAGLIAASGELHYLRTVMPLPWALSTMVLLALSWVLVVGQARRVMAAVASPWAVLAYPIFWCAAGAPHAGRWLAHCCSPRPAWLMVRRGSPRRRRRGGNWPAWP